MRTTRALLLLPGLLIALAVASGSVSASGCYLVEGELWAPWPAGAPPDGLQEALSGAHVVMPVASPPAGGSYRFSADLEAEDCRFLTCLRFPALAVAWYAEGGSVLRIDEASGLTIEGAVPEGTHHGLVMYRTAPYLTAYPVPYPTHVTGLLCP